MSRYMTEVCTRFFQSKSHDKILCCFCCVINLQRQGVADDLLCTKNCLLSSAHECCPFLVLGLKKKPPPLWQLGKTEAGSLARNLHNTSSIFLCWPTVPICCSEVSFPAVSFASVFSVPGLSALAAANQVKIAAQIMQDLPCNLTLVYQYIALWVIVSLVVRMGLIFERSCGQLFYGKPEPAWLINSRRRQYGDSQYSGGSYSGQPSFGPYSQGSALPVSSCSHSLTVTNSSSSSSSLGYQPLGSHFLQPHECSLVGLRERGTRSWLCLSCIPFWS